MGYIVNPAGGTPINTADFWNINGNNNLTGTNFFGTNNTNEVVYKINSLPYGYDNSTDAITARGGEAADQNTGSIVVALGFRAAKLNNAQEVVAIGNSAGLSNTGNNLNAIGQLAGQQNTGNQLTAIGGGAGLENQGSEVIALGTGAAIQNEGNVILALGYDALRKNTGFDVIGLGIEAGYSANVGNSLNGQFIVSTRSLPAFANHSAAVTALTIANGCRPGSTYLYRELNTNKIGFVTIP